jgi:ATP-binding cassette subfamily B protein/subfamily B ATP-binding cassette protein MsbA
MNSAPAQPCPAAGRLRSVLRLALSRWRGWSAIAFATLASSLVALLHPWPMAKLIDDVLVADASAPHVPLTAALLAAAGVALFLIDSVLGWAIARSWITVGQRLVYELAGRLFAHAQRRSLVFHGQSNVGDLLSRITGDSWCVYNVAAAVLFTPAQALILTAAAVAILWPVNAWLTGLALCVAPLQALAAVYFGHLARKAHRGERENEARVESHVQQTLAGIPVVQSFAQEQRELARFAELTGSAVRSQRRAALVGGVAHLFGGGVAAAGSAVVLFFAAREVMTHRMTLGQMQLFLAYTGMLHGELSNLCSAWASLQGARASVDRAMELLEPRIEVDDPPHPVPLPPAPAGRRFECDRVTFAYAPGRPVLRDVSLTIAPGEVVAVVGPSGSGKSTLASLLLRLLDPQSGCIRIDGIDVRRLRLDEVRAAVAVAPQEPTLLPDTVAANIAAGLPATAAQLRDAAGRAQADFIDELDEGFDTVLGEWGSTLSGGQRQRVAVARALARDAALLVLDEPTSALDPDTERRLIDLSARPPHQGVLLIAHRMSVARRAGRIVVMQAGEVVEAGGHDELLARGGLYARLHGLQSGASAAEPAGVAG